MLGVASIGKLLADIADIADTYNALMLRILSYGEGGHMEGHSFLLLE